MIDIGSNKPYIIGYQAVLKADINNKNGHSYSLQELEHIASFLKRIPRKVLTETWKPENIILSGHRSFIGLNIEENADMFASSLEAGKVINANIRIINNHPTLFIDYVLFDIPKVRLYVKKYGYKNLCISTQGYGAVINNRVCNYHFLHYILGPKKDRTFNYNDCPERFNFIK